MALLPDAESNRTERLGCSHSRFGPTIRTKASLTLTTICRSLNATTTQLRNIQGGIVSKYRYDMNAFSLVSS